jgi:phosphatidylglycerophosphatase A
VADEYATFPLVMIGLPVDRAEWWIVLVAFLAARFFDIVKFWPSRGLQKVRGGLGIVIDDVFASLYALAFTHGAVLTIRHLLAP